MIFKSNRKNKIKNKILFRYLTIRGFILIAVLGAVIFTNTYYAQLIRVSGTSMEPTLKVGSRKIVEKMHILIAK